MVDLDREKSIGIVYATMLDYETNEEMPSDGNDEFIVSGYSIHDSWKIAWPKVIARAWNIEFLLKERKIIKEDPLAEEEEEFYKSLRNEICEALKWPQSKIGDIICNLIEDVKKKERVKREIQKDISIFGESEVEIKKRAGNILDKLPMDLLKSFYRGVLQNFKKEIVENNVGIAENRRIDPGDFEWYKKLLSHKSEMVLEALMEEGFIINAMENPPINFERNVSTRIIVRKANQSYVVEKKRNLGDSEISHLYSKCIDRTERVSVSYETQKKDFIGKGKIFNGCRINGWSRVKGLGHVLILTLPPRPKNPEEFGMAATEYEAAGRVYPHTMC